MVFDLGAGLSEMGKSVATTAGDAAINQQKADLDQQKEVLADQLASTRETNLEGLRQRGEIATENLRNQHALDMIPAQTKGQIDVVKAQSQAQIDAHVAELTADTKETINKAKALSTPDMLAAQHAIAAASAIPNLQLTTAEDGTAQTYNPMSGKITPIMSNGVPVKLQNPEIAKAVVEQTNALRAAGSDLDRNMKADLDAYKMLHKDDAAEDQDKGIAAIQNYYRPKLNEVNNQLLALTAVLGAKTGVDNGAPPKGAPPLSSFVKSPQPTPGTSTTSPSMMNGTD